MNATDDQSKSCALEPRKRKRGRPSTGKALTPADKQRAYRERQKNRSAAEKAEAAEALKTLRQEVQTLREQEQNLSSLVHALKSEIAEKDSTAPGMEWIVEAKYPGSRKWEPMTDKPLEDSNGTPFGLARVKQLIEQFMLSGSKAQYRAVGKDGLQYIPPSYSHSKKPSRKSAQR